MRSDQYIAWVSAQDTKWPADPSTGAFPIDAHQPKYWLSRERAELAIADLGEQYGLAYVFTEDDPYVFLDIDHAKTGDVWSDLARGLAARFPAAYIEVSTSGTGLHIIFSAQHIPPHACKNKKLSIEIYHTGRFVALTGTNSGGSADADYTIELIKLVDDYFSPHAEVLDATWTTAPVPNYGGSSDDAVLLAHARSNASFTALWNADAQTLRAVYPDPSRDYDASSADMALAMHLAYWTGKDCARIERLMLHSQLTRDKWQKRPGYLHDTIMRACARCEKIVERKGDVQAVPAQADTSMSWACDVRDGLPGLHPLTELGNAARLYDRFGKIARYVPEVDGWILWDRGWKWDTNGAKMRMLASTLAAGLYADAVAHREHAPEIVKWARQSQQLRVITNSVKLFADRVYTPFGLLDHDDMVLGLPDGNCVELDSGVVRAARQDELITKQAAASPGDAQKCTLWLRFLNEMLQGDQELIHWLRRYFGYCLTGRVTEHMFLFAYGHGRNGKSTIFNHVLYKLMGDYARTLSVAVVTGHGKDIGSATPELSALVGARYAVSTEVPDSSTLNEPLIKSITAGDMLPIRQLYQQTIDWYPQVKLTLFGNYKPIIHGNDAGIWSRVYFMPLTVQISDAARDLDLAEKLAGEFPHILAWAIEGCRDWLRMGLDTALPACMHAAKDAYKREMDTIGTFLDECTHPAGTIVQGVLYGRYTGWCEVQGLKRPLSAIAFARKLRERGVPERRTASCKMWTGISLSFS